MKILIRLLTLLVLLTSTAYTTSFNILVLPSDIIQIKENYYGFNGLSEIISNDIIYEFNKSNGKISSPELYNIKEELNKNIQLKSTISNTILQYKNNNIDYKAFKIIGDNFNCKFVLLVSGYATTNKISNKRDIWELLEVASNFDISYPYRMEIPIVLIDIENEMVMWSNNYSSKLGDNNNNFQAKNYVQANAQYEKIKIYSRNIVAPSVSQNIILRFFPKSIKPILKENEDTPSGGALRFERKLPEEPQRLKPKENFYGDMIYGI